MSVRSERLRRRMALSRQLLNRRPAPALPADLRAPTEAERETLARRRSAEMQRALNADDFDALLRAARPSGSDDE